MRMRIPLVDLAAGFGPIQTDVMAAISGVLGQMDLHLGPNTRAFEEEFAEYCGARYAVGTGSGTSALRLALESLGVGEGDEVITSPLTFFATAEAIIHAGATPVFADVEPGTLLIDPDRIEERITPRTKAIVPVHLYGQAADMDRILSIASRHSVWVVEDACQAHGTLYRERRAGAIGHAGCFSFYYTKNLGGYGEGGAVVTSRDDVRDRVGCLRNHGHITKYEHEMVGYNERFDEIQAAILRIKLKTLEESNAKRRVIARHYDEKLAPFQLVLPKEEEFGRHVYHLYVVRTKRRDELQAFLADAGIGTGIHYRHPVFRQKALRHLGIRDEEFPNAVEACQEILSLPMFPELSVEDVEYVAGSIGRFFGR